MKLSVEVEDLGKKYLISRVTLARYRTLGDALTRKVKRLGRRIVDVFGPSDAGVLYGDTRETIWALRRATFGVSLGEKLGIIGANGSGKSTLLKLLARITEPSEGRGVIRGRVGSLLEVGTGFHNELTGRENVYLNGAILGMRRSEIKARFDNIVSFAGVEAFLDTPVKRYSSGMRVRLGFSVAAHLDPEVLLVDEVLAVGDMEFQKRCLGKIDEVASQGRTVLFVSHNMSSISELCDRVLLLEGGRIVQDGPTAEVVDAYVSRSLGSVRGVLGLQDHRAHDGVRFTEIRVCDVTEGSISGESDLTVEFDLVLDEAADDLLVQVGFATMAGAPIAAVTTDLGRTVGALEPGSYTCSVRTSLPFAAGHYLISLGADRREQIRARVARVPRAATFFVRPAATDRSGRRQSRDPAPVRLQGAWDLRRKEQA